MNNIEVTDVDVRERDNSGHLMVRVPINDIRRVAITTGFLSERPIAQIVLGVAATAGALYAGRALASTFFIAIMGPVAIIFSLRRGRYLRVETQREGVRKLHISKNTDEKLLREQLINAGVTFTET